MGLILGIESPIRSNENLHTVVGGKLVLFTSALDRGARISVVAKSASDWVAIRPLVLQALPVDGDRVLLGAWSGSRVAMTATRAEMQRIRLSNAGWAIESFTQADADTLYAAALATTSDQLVLPLPGAGIGGTAFIQLPSFELGTFAARFAQDLTQLAVRELAPSLALIEWLLDRGGALGYHVKDDLNRVGLVLLGELGIPANLDGFEIAHDENAGCVFRQGWDS